MFTANLTNLTIAGIEPSILSVQFEDENLIFSDFVTVVEDVSSNISTSNTVNEIITQDQVNANIQPDSNTVNTSVPGQYVITYNYTDSDGDSADSKQLVVTVVDIISPVITLSPASSTYNVSIGDVFTLPVATLTGNVDQARVLTPTSNDIDTSEVGVYTVTYTATDTAGNSATPVSITVNVFDTTLIKSTAFKISQSRIVAFSGSDNITMLKFTPPANAALQLFNGSLDLEKNNIKAIEFISTDGKITSDDNFVTLDNELIKVKFGKMDGIGQYSLQVVAVLLSDERIVLAGPGMPANIVLDLHE